MKRILVTGGTGFIGRHLVQRLVADGHHVRCLVRARPERAIPSPLPVEVVAGDILIPESLPPAIRDVELIYHLAGATLVLDPAEYERGNGLGNYHLAQACARCATPPLVIYLSSLAAAGPAPADEPLTEAAAPAPVSAYGRSKLQGEHHYRAVADRVPVTVIRPPSVFGPGDSHTLPLFRSVKRGIHFLPGRRSLRMSWIFVTDLVAGMVQAADRGERLGAAGDATAQGQGIYYLALEEQPTLAEMGTMVAAALGRRLWCTVRAPAPLCRLFARGNDVLARLRGRPMLLTSDKITEGLAGSWLCTAAKARRALNFECRTDLATGLQQTVAWYRNQGWL